jgi:hypothetical protein
VTFCALGEIVKAQCGIHENDAADVAAERLAQSVADVVPEADRRWVEASLRPLVGLAPEDVALRDRRSELYAGWRVFLEAVAEQRPLVLVIDDLHWADDGMLDFVDALVELVEDVALLVVACARPELLERRPGWSGGKRNALTVSLGARSAQDTERLVESLLGRDPADDELRATVAERAAGNLAVGDKIAAMGARVVNEQGLEPVARTRTIHKDGLVTDGPFLETKEVIAGFFVVETTDFEQAVAIGKLLPIMDGAVEVRPLLE